MGGSSSASLVAAIVGSSNCTTAFDTNGGVAVYIVVLLYSFLGTALVCDDYFVPALEDTAAALGMSEDVAGATLMAAGSSAPELAIATVSTLVSPSEVGVGTIIGSAVFNLWYVHPLWAFACVCVRVRTC